MDSVEKWWTLGQMENDRPRIFQLTLAVAAVSMDSRSLTVSMDAPMCPDVLRCERKG